MGKGSNFEREICRMLSLWWSGGKSDAIFWRTSQSGGRATQRAKSGKETFGSYGDIAAVDPIGQPLLEVFTIELKRGRSHGSPIDLFDAKRTKRVRPFEAAINQAMSSVMQAHSKFWMLICRRDRKETMVYMDADVLKQDCLKHPFWRPPAIRFDLQINQPRGLPVRIRFVGMPLQEYLKRINPGQICRGLKGFCYR